MFGLNGATKDVALRSRWPLLPETGDPDALAFRVAYRLASLGYSARRLEHSHFASRDVLRGITQGRIALSTRDVADIAFGLGLDDTDLNAPLTDDEFNAWAFNSASTRHRLRVWRNAETSWNASNWPLREAARILQMSPGRLHDALDNRSPRRLLYPKAVMLSTALQIDLGARAFLDGVPHHWRDPAHVR